MEPFDPRDRVSRILADVRREQKRARNITLALGVGLLVSVSIWATVIYVVAHFIRKFW